MAVVHIFGNRHHLAKPRTCRDLGLTMNEIRVQGILHERYKTDFSKLVHKLTHTFAGPVCTVSKSCGTRRACEGEMRGPLRDKIQNAINRALSESLDNQAAFINIGGRRRNRKKKQKKNGVTGSAWSAIQLQAAVPPIRSQLDIPPKARGSPQVTKHKKCKDIKARLSPPRISPPRLSPPRGRKENLDQDSKPLIDGDAGEDLALDNSQLDQENLNPGNMPFDLFKKKKDKKKKKTKDGTDKNATEDASSATADPASTELQTATMAADGGDVTHTSTTEDGSKMKMGDASDVTIDQKAHDSPAVLQTGAVTMTSAEGPQLTQSEGGVVDSQPTKSQGREKESLLHDHHPEGLICCTIL